MRHKIISFVGRSNSGKTTILKNIIKSLQEKNYKISIIKHTHADFEIDHEGTDTHTLKKSGAVSVAITNDKKFAFISDRVISPLEIAENFMSENNDLIIIEGFKNSDIPKIEVIGDSDEPGLYLSGTKNIIALVSDKNIQSDIPVFRRNAIEQLCDFIEKNFITQ